MVIAKTDAGNFKAKIDIGVDNRDYGRRGVGHTAAVVGYSRKHAIVARARIGPAITVWRIERLPDQIGRVVIELHATDDVAVGHHGCRQADRRRRDYSGIVRRRGQRHHRSHGLQRRRRSDDDVVNEHRVVAAGQICSDKGQRVGGRRGREAGGVRGIAGSARVICGDHVIINHHIP